MCDAYQELYKGGSYNHHTYVIAKSVRCDEAISSQIWGLLRPSGSQ